MCDRRRARTSSPRSRWGRLYATALLGVAALTLVELRVGASPLRIGLEGGVIAGVWSAVAAWGRANRVALDLEQWCDCGRRGLAVRVIASRPAQPSRATDTEMTDVLVEDGATLLM